MRHKGWGGPLGGPRGPRGSPWTRFSPTKSVASARSKPTRASAADGGVRPTIYAECPLLRKLSGIGRKRLPHRDAQNGFQTAVHIRIRGGPGRDADAHGSALLPLRGAAPGWAVLLYACDHAGGVFGSAEGHQHLVKDHVIQDFEAGAREAVRETFGAAAIAVDQLGQSTAP